MTAHNVAKSYNMLNAQNAAGEIDYAAVRLNFGNLTGAEGVKVEHDDAGVISAGRIMPTAIIPENMTR